MIFSPILGIEEFLPVSALKRKPKSFFFASIADITATIIHYVIVYTAVQTWSQ